MSDKNRIDDDLAMVAAFVALVTELKETRVISGDSLVDRLKSTAAAQRKRLPGVADRLHRIAVMVEKVDAFMERASPSKDEPGFH
jgi:hypothetical protein